MVRPSSEENSDQNALISSKSRPKTKQSNLMMDTCDTTNGALTIITNTAEMEVLIDDLHQPTTS